MAHTLANTVKHWQRFDSTYHSSTQRSIRRRLCKDLVKVAGVAGTAARNDGDLDGSLDIVDELEIKAAIRAVRVDAVEQDLSGAHGLDGCDELADVNVSALAPALD